MHSSHLKLLFKRLFVLRNRYFTRNPSSLPPANNDITPIRSFVVFFHAEIEFYLEEMARAILNSAHTKFSAGVFSKSQLSMVIYLLAKKKIPKKYNQAYEDMTQAMSKCRTIMHSYCSSNHGIRARNLLKLYIPLGIDRALIDVNLLNELDSYGKLRGSYAHVSESAIQNVGTALDEYNRAKRLIIFIAKFDEYLCTLV